MLKEGALPTLRFSGAIQQNLVLKIQLRNLRIPTSLRTNGPIRTKCL